MNLILLPGNSKRNEEWISKIENSLKDKFDSTFILKYSHWKFEEEKIIDLKSETKKLKIFKKNEDLIVFAKSAGVLLSLKAIKEKIISPKKCIFLGSPINWAIQNNLEIDKLFSKYSTLTLFIQKSKDPAYSFKELKKFLEEKEVKNYKLIEFPGDDHNYEDINKIKEKVQDFLK